MNFENLKVWKRSCLLSVDVYKAMKNQSDYGFRDQLTRSSLSVPSNIAEGMVKPTLRDKIKYLHIANGSSVEMRTQIYIGIKIDYISPEVGTVWIRETKEISSMLMGLIKTLNQ